MNQKLINWSFWLSLIAIVLSFAIILLWIIGSVDISVVSLDSFVGVSVALLTIIVTLLVGWQIYNAIEIKEKIKVVDELVSRQKQNEHEFNQMIYNAWHHIANASAHLSAKDQDYANAFRLLHNSLCNSLMLDHPINTEIILQEMSSYLEKITKGYPMEKDLWEEMNDEHQSILQSPSYDCIQKRYSEIYEAFATNIRIV